MGRNDRGRFDTMPLVTRAVACALLALVLGAVSARRHHRAPAPPPRAAAIGPRVALAAPPPSAPRS